MSMGRSHQEHMVPKFLRNLTEKLQNCCSRVGPTLAVVLKPLLFSIFSGLEKGGKSETPGLQMTVNISGQSVLAQ